MTLTQRAWSTHRGHRDLRLLWHCSAWSGCCVSARRCVVARNVGTKRSWRPSNSNNNNNSCSSNSNTIISIIIPITSNAHCRRLPVYCRPPTMRSARRQIHCSLWTRLAPSVPPEVTARCTDSCKRKKVVFVRLSMSASNDSLYVVSNEFLANSFLLFLTFFNIYECSWESFKYRACCTYIPTVVHESIWILIIVHLQVYMLSVLYNPDSRVPLHRQ